MPIGLLSIHLLIPGCTSLKEKRRRIKPLLARLHREFNISVAEVDHNDNWNQAVILCAQVSNDPAHARRALQRVLRWIVTNWPDVEAYDDGLEII